MAKTIKEYTVPLTSKRVGREQLNKDMERVRKQVNKEKKK